MVVFALANSACYTARDWKGLAVSIGDEIQRRRTEQGLSLTELARLAEVSKGYLSAVERNPVSKPSAAVLYRIAHALGTSVAELLGRPGPEGAPRTVAEPEIPASLRDFADQARLPEADIKMLADIRYRGKAPETVDDWRYIYESIRLRIERRQ